MATVSKTKVSEMEEYSAPFVCISALQWILAGSGVWLKEPVSAVALHSSATSDGPISHTDPLLQQEIPLQIKEEFISLSFISYS